MQRSPRARSGDRQPLRAVSGDKNRPRRIPLHADPRAREWRKHRDAWRDRRIGRARKTFANVLRQWARSRPAYADPLVSQARASIAPVVLLLLRAKSSRQHEPRPVMQAASGLHHRAERVRLDESTSIEARRLERLARAESPPLMMSLTDWSGRTRRLWSHQGGETRAGHASINDLR